MLAKRDCRLNAAMSAAHDKTIVIHRRAPPSWRNLV
jgi:hypothetical protein